MSEATVLIQDVEVAASKVLGWLGVGGKVLAKVEGLEPEVVAALGTILSAVGTAVQGASTDAQNPTVPLTSQEITNIKAVWSSIVAFAATFGLKI